MRLLIFGATGGTGRHLVARALEHNHEVTAFVRDPASMQQTHPGLRGVAGDATDPGAVGRTVPGHDGVLLAIGAPARARGSVRTIATREIVRVMQDSDVERLVSLSSIGIGDSRRYLSVLYRFVLVPLILRRAFSDHEGQERIIRASSLDWTIVRAGTLTDGPDTGEYHHGTLAERSGELKISRADVAGFMLNQVTDNAYVRRAAAVFS